MIRAIVTDIEGTTSDIRFVHNVLFPYARERLAAFVTARQYAEPVKSILDNLRNEIARPDASTAELIETLFTFMDEDRKSTALKALQGIIWHDGYVNGNFTGHLYPDVLPALEKWKAQGIDLYVYSSGSVAAQKLLFGYSTKVILLICSAAILIPISAQSEKRSHTAISRRISASRRRKSCSSPMYIRSWTPLKRRVFVPCN